MIRKATETYAATELDDELVLMNIDSGRFFALKGTGLSIWNLIDGKRDANAIADALIQTYEVDHTTCLAEVERFLGEMAGAGFVAHS